MIGWYTVGLHWWGSSHRNHIYAIKSRSVSYGSDIWSRGCGALIDALLPLFGYSRFRNFIKGLSYILTDWPSGESQRFGAIIWTRNPILKLIAILLDELWLRKASRINLWLKYRIIHSSFTPVDEKEFENDEDDDTEKRTEKEKQNSEKDRQC